MILAKEQKRILLDEVDINWEFTDKETLVFRELWERGEDITEIADWLRRPALEVALLIIEQAELGYIKQRENGLF
ncbi:helix-turn-helix domain containing protein [Sporosarcina sp. FSL K6-1508]|uniref:helix-turn-helix domain containing protein n=1 Tax=Sporosarcina sp. FSL K6-1508 TaxID=2921553 RepID=UPI0030FC2978